MSTSWQAEQERRPEEGAYWSPSLRSPVARQFSGSSMPSSLQPTTTPPQRAATIDALASHAFALPAPASSDIPPKDVEKYNAMFDKIDEKRAGIVPGKQLVGFFGKSLLPDAELAHIWDLSDTQNRGELNRKEFAVAMHLINTRMMGKPLPATLPKSLYPTPSAPVSPSFHHTMHVGTQQTPINLQYASQKLPQQQPLQRQQPPMADNDLLGDFGNEQWERDTNQVNKLQNQIGSLKLDTANTQRQKSEVEHALERLAQQKKELEAQMAQTKAAFDVEAKELNGLQEVLKREQPAWTQTHNEYQAAQRQLLATQHEIGQVRQSIERGRLESERFRRQVHEIQEETTRLLSDLDTLRGQAKQQDTMLDINRRQVTAVMQDRDQARRDVSDYKEARNMSQTQEADNASATSSEASPVSPAASLPITSFDAAFGDLFADMPSTPPPPPTSQSRHHHRPSTDQDLAQAPTKQLRSPPPPPPPSQAQAPPEASTETTPSQPVLAKNEEEDEFEKFFSTQLEPAKVLHADKSEAPVRKTSEDKKQTKQTDNWASSFGGFDFPDTSAQKTKTVDDDWDAIFGGVGHGKDSSSRADDNVTKGFGFGDAFASPAAAPAQEEKLATKAEDNSEAAGVDELVKMGFSRLDAQEALGRYDGDLDKATNFLLDQGTGRK